MAPDSAIAPTTDAPPDRPTADLEQWARDGLALIFGDHKFDQNERKIFRDFMEQVALRAANGGIGMGGTPPTEQSGVADRPPTPQELNQNTEDYGATEGTEPREETYA